MLMGKKVKILRRNRKLSAAARVENVRGQKATVVRHTVKKISGTRNVGDRNFSFDP